MANTTIVTTDFDTSTYKYILKDGVNKIFDATQRTAISLYPNVMNDRTTNELYVDDLQYAGLGAAQTVNEGEPIPILSPTLGEDKRYTQGGTGAGFRITHKMKYFNKIGMVKRLTASLSKTMVESKDVDVARLFNAPTATAALTTGAGTVGGGFDATGTDLAEDTHYKADTDYTYDNYLNQALAVSSIKSARYYFATMTDDKGMYCGAIPTVLAFEPTLYYTVKEIFGSEHIPFEQSNTINELKNMKLTFLEYPRLTSTTAWFMEAKNDDMFDINVLTSMKPIIVTRDAPDTSLDTLVLSLQYYTFGYGDTRMYFCGSA